MAKTVTFTDLLPPTDLTGSVVAGGSLSTGTTYYYVIQACFDAGTSPLTTKGRSQSSNQISASITTAGTQSVELSWTGSSGAGGYRIYRAESSGSYIQMLNIAVRESVHCSGGICTITDNGLGNPGNSQYQNTVHGKLTISGSTSGDPFSIVDLYTSSSDNGWGVITSLDQDTYSVNTYIEGTSGTYWSDTEKVIIFRDYLDPGSSSTYTFGEKIGTYTRKGCRLIFKTPDLNITSFDTLYAYKTTFDYVRFNPLVGYTGISPQFIRYNAGDVEYCLINKMRGFQPQSSANCTMSDTTITEADVALGAGKATFTNVTGMRNSRVFQTTNNTVIVAEGVKFIDNTGTLLIGTNFDVTYINSTNGSISDNAFPNTQGFSRDVFTYDLKVTDRDGNSIENVDVLLKNKSGDTIFNTTTDSDGNITTQQAPLLLNTVINGTLTRENLSPYTLIISKDGYDEYREITTYSESIALKKTITLDETGSLNTNIYGGTFYNSTIY